MNPEKIEIKVKDILKKTRIDKYLENELLKLGYSYSRSQIQKNISNILLNNKSVKKNTSVNNGDLIIFYPPLPQKISLEPEDIFFEIVYEDDSILIVNKPKGLIVHPAKGNYSGTLVNGLINRIKDFKPIAGTIRPGIVHRLDKDTSGLMVIAKSEDAYKFLANAFKERKVKKIYHCICVGVPSFSEKIIENYIGRHPFQRKKFAVREKGKLAKTKIKVIRKFNHHTLLKIRIFTGRTHQIRVHLSHLGFPIAGDPIYSKTKNKYPEGLALIAKELSFMHPNTKAEICFEINYPEHFLKLLERIK